MNWYTETYDEIEDRLRDQIPALRAVELYNNQFDDLKSETENEEYPFDFPCCFIAFGGGNWERQPDGSRMSRDYELRLHVGSETYDEGREHLENITAFANALDGWTGTYIKTEYRREVVDDERRNVIEHTLIFICTVCDDSAINGGGAVTFKKAESKYIEPHLNQI
jgi:hypothetical protein